MDRYFVKFENIFKKILVLLSSVDGFFIDYLLFIFAFSVDKDAYSALSDKVVFVDQPEWLESIR